MEREDQVLVTDWRGPVLNRSRITIWNVDLHRRGLATRRYNVALPQNREVECLKFSPQGDRIAWVLHEDQTSEMPRILHYVFPHVAVATRHLVSVYVSLTDGSEMHRLGYIEITNKQNEEFDEPVQNIQWLPSGKRLSFLYRNRLYTVAAE